MVHQIIFSAVRKNRYVILPIDFEEAWKVSLVWFCLASTCQIKLSLTFVFLSTSKRSREAMRLMNSVSFASYYFFFDISLMFACTFQIGSSLCELFVMSMSQSSF